MDSSGNKSQLYPSPLKSDCAVVLKSVICPSNIPDDFVIYTKLMQFEILMQMPLKFHAQNF